MRYGRRLGPIRMRNQTPETKAETGAALVDERFALLDLTNIFIEILRIQSTVIHVAMVRKTNRCESKESKRRSA